MLGQSLDGAKGRSLGRSVVIDKVVAGDFQVSLRVVASDLLSEELALENNAVFSRQAENIVFLALNRSLRYGISNYIERRWAPSLQLPKLRKPKLRNQRELGLVLPGGRCRFAAHG